MSQRAVTLPELLLVLVMLAILVGTGVPRVVGIADRAALREARAEVLRGLDAARGAALRLGQPVELVAATGAIQVATATSAAPLWQIPEPHQVTMLGLAAPIRFGPSGIAMGAANRTLRLARGSDSLTVVLSRLGRIR